MNDILRWAKEADLWMTSDERIAAVERFAALVRADEREQCAALADAQRSNTNVLLSYPPQSSAAYNIGIAIRARKES